MSKTPSIEQVKQAQETIAKYEQRQKDLEYLKGQLSEKLEKFGMVNFKVDKKKKQVIFAGYLTDKKKLVIGQSVCGAYDKFEDVIGKLIAVKKALNEDMKDVVKFVEVEKYIVDLETLTTITSDKITIGKGGYTSTWIK